MRRAKIRVKVRTSLGMREGTVEEETGGTIGAGTRSEGAVAGTTGGMTDGTTDVIKGITVEETTGGKREAGTMIGGTTRRITIHMITAPVTPAEDHVTPPGHVMRIIRARTALLPERGRVLRNAEISEIKEITDLTTRKIKLARKLRWILMRKRQ